MNPIYINLKLEGGKNKFQDTYICPLPQNFNTNSSIKVGVAGVDLHLQSIPEDAKHLKIRALEANNHRVMKAEKNTLFVTRLRSDHINCENIHPAYLSFDDRSLTYLSFKITDLRDTEIFLSDQVPSFIRLKVMEMRGPSDIHLYFEESIDENGKILIDLANRIVLPEGYNWSMSLAKIGFHNPNHHKSPNYFYFCGTRRGELEETRFGAKTNDFLLMILKAFLTRIEPDENKLKLSVSEDNRVTFSSSLEEPVTFQCNKDLGHLMGVDSNYNLCDKKIVVHPHTTFQLNQELNLKRPLMSTLFVQSSVLHPSIMNDSFSPILRMSPNFTKEAYYYRKFDTQEYVARSLTASDR